MITTVRLDILQVNIVTKHKYIIYTCVLYLIGNMSIMLDFRPTPIYNRNYNNDAKRAITANYVSASDDKIPVLYHRQIFLK